MTRRIVIVGASLAGLRAAENVRKAGYAGEVVVIGAESHQPYHRPPLSKNALADSPDAPDSSDGLDPGSLALPLGRYAQSVTWRFGRAVTTCDLDGHTVTLDDGTVLRWEGLVVATGLRPCRLDLPGPAEGRHALRTLDDAHRLRASLTRGTRLVVVGAGFIGCEVAATARGLGVEVDVVAPESTPMEWPLQAELGRVLQRRHERAAVSFHLGVLPVALDGDGRLTGLLLSDGHRIDADLVLEAIGTQPAVDWLDGNGLDLSDGVLCDNDLRVQGRPDVVACGDIARFPNPLFDDVPRRVEHWTMASDTGKHAGKTLGSWLTTGADPAEKASPAGTFAPVPSFWTDQHDLHLQSFGAVGLGGDDVRVLEGDLSGEVTVGYHRDGQLVGVVCVGMDGRQRHWRNTIAARLPA